MNSPDPTERPDVVFYFGTSGIGSRLYQLEQWLKPLQRLSLHCKVAVVTSNEELERVVQSAGLKVYDYPNDAQAKDSIRLLGPKVVLYPNKGPDTPKPTSYPSAIHVFVSHGESDKAYMSDNTLRYFDYVYTAGEMAVKRIVERLKGFDVEARCITIGRPQGLNEAPEAPSWFNRNDSRTTILYAPTADFLSRSNRYGSVETHGVKMVESILSQGDKYRLIYKPHPLTGSKIPGSKVAHQRILDAIANADNEHHYDQTPFGWHMQAADLLISDVSALIYDWLATSKPILITKPAEPLAWVYRGGVLGALDLIDESQAANICEELAAALSADGSESIYRHWGEKYFASANDEVTGQERFILETLRLVELAKDLPVSPAPKQPSSSNLNSSDASRTSSGLVTPATKAMARRALANMTNRRLNGDYRLALHLSANPVELKLLRRLANGQKTAILVSSLSNYLKVARFLIQRGEQNKNLTLIYAPNVAFVTKALTSVQPKSIWYLDHSPKNHFGIRSHESEHVLLCPEQQRGFVVDHNLIAYDKIQTTDDKLAAKVTEKVFRPDSWNFELIS